MFAKAPSRSQAEIRAPLARHTLSSASFSYPPVTWGGTWGTNGWTDGRTDGWMGGWTDVMPALMGTQHLQETPVGALLGAAGRTDVPNGRTAGQQSQPRARELTSGAAM